MPSPSITLVLPSPTSSNSSTVTSITSTFSPLTGKTLPAASGSHKILDDAIVSNGFDIAILAVLAVFFLAFLPRALARFSIASEWGKGLILRAGAAAHTTRRPSLRKAVTPVSNDKETPEMRTEESHTYVNHTQQTAGGHSSGKKATQYSTPPKHVDTWSTRTYPISSFFAKPIAPGTSLGEVFLLFLYLLGATIVIFLSANPITNQRRPATLAVSQIPVAVALSMKVTIPGLLLGIGYVNLNYLHRWVGLVVAVAANLHFLGYVVQYVTAGTLSAELRKPENAWGVVSLVGVDMLSILSMPFIRGRAYNFFYASHLFGFALFVFAACQHNSVSTKYVVIAAIIYAVDRTLRLVKTRLCTALVRPIPELSLTCIEIPQLTHGWRAGQHVRLRILSRQLGILGWAEVHPFTVATASRSDSGKGLVLMCKRAGDWTGSLYEVANKAAYYGSENGYGYRKLKVLVEGPYGGMGHMTLASYSAAMIVAGGSGVTFVLSVAEELIQKVVIGAARTKFIEIVWTAQDFSSLVPFLSDFAALVNSCESVPGVIVTISVFYTRAIVPSSSNDRASDTLKSLPAGLKLRPGRPKLSRILDSVMERSTALQDVCGVAVAVCGPIGLVEEVKKVTRDIDGSRRAAVRGIDVHDEVFSW